MFRRQRKLCSASIVSKLEQRWRRQGNTTGPQQRSQQDLGAMQPLHSRKKILNRVWVLRTQGKRTVEREIVAGVHGEI